MNTEMQQLIEDKATEIKRQLAQFSLDSGLLEEGIQLQFTLTAKLVDPISQVIHVTSEEPLLKEVITREKLIEAGLSKLLAGKIITCLENNALYGWGYRSGGAKELEELDWETATFDQFQVLYGRLEDPKYLRGNSFAEGCARGLLQFMIHFGYYNTEE